eukprot:TRINITY_DN4042_c0_g1_i1.p1 TRINITY_DN4042_c0_g1~~TRINITY_DN4042_c0_g1_i1.p1  ORF type:complete len:439 (-),score=33.85 TRINITY_DN4042_c0_g1_i1:42-1358(-)
MDQLLQTVIKGVVMTLNQCQEKKTNILHMQLILFLYLKKDQQLIYLHQLLVTFLDLKLFVLFVQKIFEFHNHLFRLSQGRLMVSKLNVINQTNMVVVYQVVQSNQNLDFQLKTMDVLVMNVYVVVLILRKMMKTQTHNHLCVGVIDSYLLQKQFMLQRAEVAKHLGVPIIMHDYLTAGFTANTSLANYCRDHGLLLHIHRAMHAVIDRQRNHGMHFRVLAKALRLSGGDHLHSGTVVGKLEGDREVTMGFVDLMRDDYIEKDRSRGIYFTQDWLGRGGVFPVASGGIHVWHMPALVEIFGDDACLQFGGGTLGHPWGNAPGAVANRVALEACVQARNEGRNLAREGGDIIRDAAKWSPELAAACEVWKEIKFEFDIVDKLQSIHTLFFKLRTTQLTNSQTVGTKCHGGEAPTVWEFQDRKSTRLNSSHEIPSRMPSSA